MKLYEINKAILECVDPETGELIDFEKFNELQIEKEEKIEGVALWYKDLIAEANAIKEEKDRLAEREKSARNKAERLKKYLAYTLNGEQFKTARCALSFRKSEKVIVEDIYKLPENYLKYSEPKADLTELKKAIKNGEEINGVHIEKTQNIQIK